MGWKTAELNERAMAFWRDKDEVRQYLPDYIFSTWRQIRKNYPIEAFDYNVFWSCGKSGFYGGLQQR